MASYSSSNYSNGFYDLSGIYFNPVSSTSSIDITTLDERYLKLSGGTISNNLIISNSLDVQTSLTLPIIGNVETEIQAKQDTINDGDLTIAKTSNLQSSLDTLKNNVDVKQDIIDTNTTLQLNTLHADVITIEGGNVLDLLDTKQDTITTSSSLSLTGISTTGSAIFGGSTYLNGTTIATGNLQVSTHFIVT